MERYRQTYVLTFFGIIHFLFLFFLIVSDSRIKKVLCRERTRQREKSEGVDIARVTIHRPTRGSQAAELPTVKHAPL